MLWKPRELLELVVPYLKEAGYQLDATADRDWLLPLMSLIGPSLTRLPDAVDLSRFFVTETIELADDARAQLQLEGVSDVIQAVITGLTADVAMDSAEELKSLVNQVTKAQGVKKGLVMKSLRAALMGTLQGPDLMDSWLILRQRQFDVTRLQAAAIAAVT